MNNPAPQPVVLLTVGAEGGVNVQQTGNAVVLVVHESTKPSCVMLLPQTNDVREITQAVQSLAMLHDHSERSTNLASHLRSKDGMLQKAPPAAVEILRRASGSEPIGILHEGHADEVVTAFNNFPDLVTAATSTAVALETIERSLRHGSMSQSDARRDIELEARNLRLALELAGPL